MAALRITGLMPPWPVWVRDCWGSGVGKCESQPLWAHAVTGPLELTVPVIIVQVLQGNAEGKPTQSSGAGQMVRKWPLCNIHVSCLPIKACSLEKLSKLSSQRLTKLGKGNPQLRPAILFCQKEGGLLRNTRDTQSLGVQAHTMTDPDHHRASSSVHWPHTFLFSLHHRRPPLSALYQDSKQI